MFKNSDVVEQHKLEVRQLTQNARYQRASQIAATHIREQIRQLVEYHKLVTRRYREPSGYASHRSICYELAKAVWNAQVCPGGLDWVTTESAFIAYQVAHLEAPTLWLNNALAVALKETDIPDQIIGLKRVLPAGIIMLPKSLFKTPDDQHLTFIAWIHQLPEDEIIDINLGARCTITSPHLEHGQISWFSGLPSGEVYHGNIKCLPDGVEFGAIDLTTNLQHFMEVDEGAESEVLAILERLITQILLVMQVRPDLVDEARITQVTQGVGFKKSKAETEAWSPRWIGKNYVIREETVAAPPGGGTHASPRPHWRKGHLRRIPVGPREENQRKWHWIEPTWICP